MKVTLINATSYVSMATGKKYEKGNVYEVDAAEGRTLLAARYVDKPFFRQIYENDPEFGEPTEAPVVTKVAPKKGVNVVRKQRSAKVNDEGELDTAANAVDV